MRARRSGPPSVTAGVGRVHPPCLRGQGPTGGTPSCGGPYIGPDRCSFSGRDGERRLLNASPIVLERAAFPAADRNTGGVHLVTCAVASVLRTQLFERGDGLISVAAALALPQSALWWRRCFPPVALSDESDSDHGHPQQNSVRHGRLHGEPRPSGVRTTTRSQMTTVDSSHCGRALA
jgi:hypothetical protein